MEFLISFKRKDKHLTQKFRALLKVQMPLWRVLFKTLLDVVNMKCNERTFYQFKKCLYLQYTYMKAEESRRIVNNASVFSLETWKHVSNFVQLVWTERFYIPARAWKMKSHWRMHTVTVVYRSILIKEPVRAGHVAVTDFQYLMCPLQKVRKVQA